MYKNITLLCCDNPISRSYINLLIEKGIKIEELIYYINSSYSFFPSRFACFLTYAKNNYYAINFLKEKNLSNLLNEIAKGLDFNNDIFKKIYNFKNIYNISNKISFVKNENINSHQSLKVIQNTKSNIILFAGRGLLKKNILNINKKFIHIHPGYLPEIRGADGLLWSIKKQNRIGVSSFIMNEKIDSGDIILREKYSLPIFKNKSILEKKQKDVYRFIYSFIDPIIRTKHLNKLLIHAVLLFWLQ